MRAGVFILAAAGVLLAATPSMATPATLPLLALGPWGWAAFAALAVITVVTVHEATKAHQQADSLPDEDAVPCQACARAQAKAEEAARTRTNPCAELAGGVPGSPYRGGADGAMRVPVGDNLQSHHTPSDTASYLPRAMGPAIQMENADHKLTTSYGSGTAARAYQAAQEDLINSGNFMGAIAMDVADIHSKFGDKYDGALAQMMAYADCLKQNGLIE